MHTHPHLHAYSSHQKDSNQGMLSANFNQAATIIQKHVRGWLARQSHLSSDLVPCYREQYAKLLKGDTQGMLRAQAGKTRVLLPLKEKRIVLKCTGPGNAIRRFGFMQKIRSILREQRSSHLVVPKANKWNDVLIEERLPVDSDSYHNMGIYTSSPELFNDAVRELTRLFSRVYINDLISYYNLHPLGKIPDVNNFVRYDNLPLYIIEKSGKKEGRIGLIDLERVEDRLPSNRFEILARIFPYHLEIIQNQLLELKVEFDANQLNTQAICGRKYLQVGLIDHLNWLKIKKITPSSPVPFSVSKERRDFLITKVEEELLKINQGKSDFIKEASSIFAPSFAKIIVPSMICGIRKELEVAQERLLKSWGFDSGLSEEITPFQLVSLRSPLIALRQIYLDPNETNIPIQFIQQRAISNYLHNRWLIKMRLCELIIEELVRGGEAFSFNISYKSNQDSTYWVRY